MTQFKARRNLHKLARFYFSELGHYSKFFELYTYTTPTPPTKFDKLAGEAPNPLTPKLEIASRTATPAKQVTKTSKNRLLAVRERGKAESA